MTELSKDENRVIDLLRDVYIKFYGREKWNALSDQQKTHVIAVLVRTSLKALETIEKEGW